jgi:predicted transcriptional regulator
MRFNRQHTFVQSPLSATKSSSSTASRVVEDRTLSRAPAKRNILAEQHKEELTELKGSLGSLQSRIHQLEGEVKVLKQSEMVSGSTLRKEQRKKEDYRVFASNVLSRLYQKEPKKVKKLGVETEIPYRKVLYLEPNGTKVALDMSPANGGEVTVIEEREDGGFAAQEAGLAGEAGQPTARVQSAPDSRQKKRKQRVIEDSEDEYKAVVEVQKRRVKEPPAKKRTSTRILSKQKESEA